MVTTEDMVEQTALCWLEGLGYETSSGPDIAPGGLFQERATYDVEVLVEETLYDIQREYC